MKSKYLFTYLLIFSAIIVFVACNDDDDVKPVISNLEVGHDDTLHVGEGVHIEFEVLDNERLDYYRIMIHEEGEHKAVIVDEVEWDFDSTFTEISGLRNYTVHHDNEVVVPEGTHLGEYHFELIVVDEAGNTAELEREVVVALEGGGDPHDH